MFHSIWKRKKLKKLSLDIGSTLTSFVSLYRQSIFLPYREKKLGGKGGKSSTAVFAERGRLGAKNLRA
jgi:hypothetical protein